MGYAQRDTLPAFGGGTSASADSRRLRDGVNYGLGLRYDMNSALGLRLEYGRFGRFAGEVGNGSARHRPGQLRRAASLLGQGPGPSRNGVLDSALLERASRPGRRSVSHCMRDAEAGTLTLVYLARLREAFGAASERVEPPPGVTTVAGLRAWLAARGGAWAVELAPGRAVRVAVNHDLAEPDTPVRPGDEVALFPPVTGG